MDPWKSKYPSLSCPSTTTYSFHILTVYVRDNKQYPYISTAEYPSEGPQAIA
jgi:hypothetical protein